MHIVNKLAVIMTFIFLLTSTLSITINHGVARAEESMLGITLTIEATETPGSTVTPDATQTPEPTLTTEPTPELTTEPTPELTIEPTPESTETPDSTVTIEPTDTPEPTETPEPTPEPTVTIEPTVTPDPSETSEPTPTPLSTSTPLSTPTPDSTPTPTSEPTVVPTEMPTPTPSLDVWQDYICKLPNGDVAPPGGIEIEIYSLKKDNIRINTSDNFLIRENENETRCTVFILPPSEKEVEFKYKIITPNTKYADGDIGFFKYSGAEIVFTINLSTQPSPTQPPPTTQPPITQPTTMTQPPTPTAILFIDLEGFEWAEQYIYLLADAGVVSGYPDMTFRPGDYATRAELTKMYIVAFQLLDETATTTFTDVPTDKWYYTYVASAQKEDLIIGNGDETFSPENEMTREELFVLTARAINKYYQIPILGNDDEETIALLDEYIDGDSVSEWARGFAATIIKNNIVVGSPTDGELKELNPKMAIRRSEVAVILGKIISEI